jgi:hypothetical protein
MYSIAFTPYKGSFPTIDQLVDDLLASGLDPAYEITKDGEPTGELASDYIAY